MTHTNIPRTLGFFQSLRSLSMMYFLLLLAFGVLFVLRILDIFTNISAIKIIVISLLNIVTFAVLITIFTLIFLFLRLMIAIWPTIRNTIDFLRERILEALGRGDMSEEEEEE